MKKQSRQKPEKSTLPELARCTTCGRSAVTGKVNRLALVRCASEDDSHGRIAVLGEGRAAKLWNKLQEKRLNLVRVTKFVGKNNVKKTVFVPKGEAKAILKHSLPVAPQAANKSGAKNSAFGRGDTESEKDFDKNAKPVKKQVDMEIDKADDRKVKVPEWVEVIDSKFGCVIGFQPSGKVFELLQSDCRFRENLTQDNVIQLFYNGEWAKNNFIEVSCSSLEDYIKLIQRNLDTVAGCDDPMHVMLQCSYEAQGRHFVANICFPKIKDSLLFIDRKLRKLISKRGTDGIIEFFQKKTGK